MRTDYTEFEKEALEEARVRKSEKDVEEKRHKDAFKQKLTEDLKKQFPTARYEDGWIWIGNSKFFNGGYENDLPYLEGNNAGSKIFTKEDLGDHLLFVETIYKGLIFNPYRKTL